jgi:hypothetical protein
LDNQDGREAKLAFEKAVIHPKKEDRMNAEDFLAQYPGYASLFQKKFYDKEATIVQTTLTAGDISLGDWLQQNEDNSLELDANYFSSWFLSSHNNSNRCQGR